MLKVHFKDVHKVRLEIAKRGLTLNDFASDIGISQSYLSQLLNESNTPSPRVAFKISNGLGVDFEEFFLINNIDISIKRNV